MKTILVVAVSTLISLLLSGSVFAKEGSFVIQHPGGGQYGVGILGIESLTGCGRFSVAVGAAGDRMLPLTTKKGCGS